MCVLGFHMEPQTTLWQVADSSQQNGKFKVLLNKAKKELFRRRMETFQHDMHLVWTDIIPLVRTRWESSFCDVQANKRAIAQRGWGPYNRALLLHPVIRASMTLQMIENEKMSEIFPNRRLFHLHDIRLKHEGKKQVSIVANAEKGSTDDAAINLNGGPTSRRVTDAIVSEKDLQMARERIQKKKKG